MKQILFTSIVLVLSFMSRFSFAGEVEVHKGFVPLADGVSRYVEYSEPQKGKPWIVFVNGLVYDISRWEAMDADLRKAGYGILHYDFRGQDRTLVRETEMFQTPLFFKTGLGSDDHAAELSELIKAFGIQDKVTVVGLSYGAHIAATFAQNYPEQVDQVVFLAPLVIPLEQYEPQGVWLDWSLAWVKATWGPYFYEYAYRQIYGTYLDQRTSDRVPPHVAEIPQVYKESLFHLVRAARDFDLRTFKFENLDKNSVFFFVSTEEKEAIFDDQLKAFEGVDAETQGSLIWLPEASHAIPDSEPRRASLYLQHIIKRDPRLEQGKRYKSTSRGLTGW